MSSLWKSSAVVLAVTAYKLLSHSSRPWLPEEELVLQAFRRSTNALQSATPKEIGAYLSNFDSAQREGMLNNVKGIFHELLYEKLENNDGATAISPALSNIQIKETSPLDHSEVAHMPASIRGNIAKV